VDNKLLNKNNQKINPATEDTLSDVSTNTNTTNTKLDTVNSSIGTTNTKLDTVDTSIGTTNTKLDTLDTSVNSSKAASDATAALYNSQIGLLAKDDLPAAVDDGDSVSMLGDTFGRPQIQGFDSATNSLQITNISPAEVRTLNITNLDDVTTATTGSAVNIEQYSYISVFLILTYAATTIDMTIEISPDGSNWFEFWTQSYTSSSDDVVVVNVYAPYIRVKSETHSDGTVRAVITGKV